MTVSLSCFAGAGWQFFDNNGVPLAGGLIYSYEAGTTTSAATYTSVSGSTAHTNPIVLDAAGRVPGGEIWLNLSVNYKFVLRDSDAVLIGTYDHVNPTISASDLANTSDVTLGDALVGFRQSDEGGNLPYAVGRTVHDKLQEFVSVKDFGAVGDGVTDDTAAIQTALNQANKKTVYFPSGTYLVSSLDVTQQFTTLHFDAAVLLGMATGTYTHVIHLTTNLFTITGSLVIDTQFNTGYDCALWIQGGYGRYENITVRYTKLAVKIGEFAANQVSLSEMFFSKFVTNGCCRAIEMYGLFSVANFTDSILVGGENSTWTGSDTTTIKNYGGRLYFENTYLYGNQDENYPILYANQTLYDGLYYTGSFYLSNIDSEVYGKPFLQVWNASTSTQAPDSGSVQIVNSRIDFFSYASLSPQPDFFYFNNYYTGRFETSNNRFKFFDALTKRPIQLGALTKAQIDLSDIDGGFYYAGTNAITYPGLPPQVPFQTGLSVVMTNSYTATDSSPVKFDTVQTGGVNATRLTLADYYSTSTGLFTVPPGGLSTILIIANYTISGGLGVSPQAWINHYRIGTGTTLQLCQCDLVSPNGQVVCMIPEAAAGDTISFITYSNSTGAVLDVSNPYNNQMTISAYITVPNS